MYIFTTVIKKEIIHICFLIFCNILRDKSSHTCAYLNFKLYDLDSKISFNSKNINSLTMKVQQVLDNLSQRFPNEPVYLQAVEELLTSIEDVYNQHPEFAKVNLIERLCIPDRIFSFRVTWVDDAGSVHTNMGYRVQHNNSIWPSKG